MCPPVMGLCVCLHLQSLLGAGALGQKRKFASCTCMCCSPSNASPCTFFLQPLHFVLSNALFRLAGWVYSLALLLSSSQIVAFSSSFPQHLAFQVHQLRLAQAAVMDQLIHQLGHYAGLLLTFGHIDVDQAAFFAIF